MVDLRPTLIQSFGFEFESPSDFVAVSVVRTPDTPQGKLVDPRRPDGGPCLGGRHELDYGADTITLRYPGRCLGEPRPPYLDLSFIHADIARAPGDYAESYRDYLGQNQPRAPWANVRVHLGRAGDKTEGSGERPSRIVVQDGVGDVVSGLMRPLPQVSEGDIKRVVFEHTPEAVKITAFLAAMQPTRPVWWALADLKTGRSMMTHYYFEGEYHVASKKSVSWFSRISDSGSRSCPHIKQTFDLQRAMVEIAIPRECFDQPPSFVRARITVGSGAHSTVGPHDDTGGYWSDPLFVG